MTLTYRIDVMDTVRKVQKWATTASNAIDSEDGRLVEQVDIINVLLSKNILKLDQAIETVWSFVRTTNNGLSVRVLARAVTP